MKQCLSPLNNHEGVYQHVSKFHLSSIPPLHHHHQPFRLIGYHRPLEAQVSNMYLQGEKPAESSEWTFVQCWPRHARSPMKELERSAPKLIFKAWRSHNCLEQTTPTRRAAHMVLNRHQHMLHAPSLDVRTFPTHAADPRAQPPPSAVPRVYKTRLHPFASSRQASQRQLHSGVLTGTSNCHCFSFLFSPFPVLQDTVLCRPSPPASQFIFLSPINSPPPTLTSTA